MTKNRSVSITTWITALAVSGCALLLGWQRQGASQNFPGNVDGAVSVRVRFGMADQQPRSWDGSVSATGGEVLNLRDWHPRAGDKITGKNSWSLSTRKGPIFARRPWDDELLVPPAPYLQIPGVVIDTQLAATLKFQTLQGPFEVKAASLRTGQPMQFLGGNATVDLVPTAQMLSETNYQNDFATLSAGKNGELWAGWIGYRNQGDEVLVRRFDGSRWAPAVKVTEKPSDVFLVKLGHDRNGSLWAVWSAQESGNFDLYARRYDGKAWSATERLTDDPQPDIYHNVATDSNGNLWVVWQGFRNGKSDIFARRFDGQSWSAAEKVSDSPANGWEPTIAADRNGRVYVAWDTYDKGNYDVRMRSYANGKWSEPVAVASTPKYEAHVSLACDGENRLWAAWNESGFEWGKDTGFLVKRQGTRLYQSRSIGMAVFQNGNWLTPDNVNQALPRDLREYNDYPVLQTGGDGRISLFFRHRMLRIADTPSDTPAHRAAWELYGTTWADGWTAPVQVPFSQGRQDVRAGFAADDRGSLWAAWPMDNRDFDEYLFQRADVYAARIPQPARMGQKALAPRQVPALQAYSTHAQESKDLAAIRDYGLQSGGKTYHIYRGDTHR
ncbi:MAG: glycoside hydrolase, partial [Acidobacteriota bacterium]|nr:glycoside hydrolase [Acidobacteriota bacterium]